MSRIDQQPYPDPVTSGFSPRSEEHLAQVIAQLADGTLHEPERSDVEAYVASSCSAQATLAEQRAVLRILRAGGPAMPVALRAQLEQEAPRRVSRRTVVRGQWIAAAAAVMVIAAVVIARPLIGDAGPPTIGQVARLAYVKPTGAPPSIDTARPDLLRERFAGITFPDYTRGFDVQPTGQRTDQTGGRTERTVYYTLPGGTQMSYTVVSGPPLGLPGPAVRTVRIEGVSVHAYQQGALHYVTLVRAGRTCVLAAKSSTRTLLALAAAPLRAAA